MARIGFVGLGHMGLPMAMNLIKVGHEVTGYDLQQAALDQLTAAGGIAATHLRQAAQQQDIIITMLQTGAQVKEVCLSEEGLYAAAGVSTLHIDCSTIDVATCHYLNQQAEQYHLMMIDAPVSGGVTGAKAATLTFMVGGQDTAFEQAKPLLEAMGKRIFHTGPAGSGQAAKICNNMILGISMIAISEAFILAEKLGLRAEKLFEVVNSSSGQCWALSHYVPVPGILPQVPANQDYQAGFTAAMMLKDLLLSQQAAEKVNVETMLGQQATNIYQQFNQDGFGQLDFSAIIKTIKR
ncbi:3-hydroxyisobutyrate dehydrogenase [Legionella beliardensis]|uniref:3-hydroxyisobutyrate dehydrogenase n=1 Tax=Legionella beliardensis TaxID=91822 RepID=A0A378HZ58_9GAMM|nr:3-hydroxyisobutyrate dehydrogenase [Legionella beliardensis]STX27655.1 3-hydroxyisobutyrate dehydrogenase [Legionella beliardensis]